MMNEKCNTPKIRKQIKEIEKASEQFSQELRGTTEHLDKVIGLLKDDLIKDPKTLASLQGSLDRIKGMLNKVSAITEDCKSMNEEVEEANEEQ